MVVYRNTKADCSCLFVNLCAFVAIVCTLAESPQQKTQRNFLSWVFLESPLLCDSTKHLSHQINITFRAKHCGNIGEKFAAIC